MEQQAKHKIYSAYCGHCEFYEQGPRTGTARYAAVSLDLDAVIESINHHITNNHGYNFATVKYYEHEI